jgi:hypothetical protein
MLFLNQSFRRGDPRGGICGVVAIKRLDRPPQHPAGLIDPLKRQLDAILLALPAIRVLSAEDGGDADANRLGGEDWKGQDATGHQSDSERHRLVLAKEAA